MQDDTHQISFKLDRPLTLEDLIVIREALQYIHADEESFHLITSWKSMNRLGSWSGEIQGFKLKAKLDR